MTLPILNPNHPKGILAAKRLKKRNRPIGRQLEHEKRSASKKMQFSIAAKACAVSKHWIFRGERPGTSDGTRRRPASRLSLCRE